MSHVNIFFFFPLALHLLASLRIWGGAVGGPPAPPPPAHATDYRYQFSCIYSSVIFE